MSLDKPEAIYHLQDSEALKRLTNHLMARSTYWSVTSRSSLSFPSTVAVSDDYRIQCSDLKELIKVDGVWRYACDSIASLKLKVPTVNVEVVTA